MEGDLSKRMAGLPGWVPVVCVAVGVILGVGFIVAGFWRRGTFVVGLTTTAAGAWRAFIPDAEGDPLRVRGRRADVAWLLTSGLIMMWLSLSIDSLGTD